MNNHNLDDHVDEKLEEYFDLDSPKSFFLFAGAGSGKTRSLVKLLNVVRSRFGERLQRNHGRVGVITYTNAARDEIRHRLKYDPLVEVSTIHSFCWELIKTHTNDIKEIIEQKLVKEIEKLVSEEEKGRPGTKASIERQTKIKSKSIRLKGLKSIRKFSYSPSGENRTVSSLNCGNHEKRLHNSLSQS